VLYPQVLGPAAAGTAWMTTNANASARIVLIDMIVLLMSKPEAASADWIGGRCVYFRARIRMELREVQVRVSAMRPSVHIVVICSITAS
jgi:hypothetical protein